MTFDIDKNGIVNVSAKDMGTNKEQKITIKSSGGLSDEEVEKMMKEAKENEAADKKRKEKSTPRMKSTNYSSRPTRR